MTSSASIPEPIEAQAQRDWASSPALRAEFGGNQSWYTALCRAQARGLVKLRAPAARIDARVATPLNPPSAADIPQASGQGAPTSATLDLIGLDLNGLDIQGLLSPAANPRPPAGPGRFKGNPRSGGDWWKFIAAEAEASGQPWWVVALREPATYNDGERLLSARTELRRALDSANERDS